MSVPMVFKLLLVSLFIGASFNLASYAVHFFAAPAAAAWRFGIAALLLLILLFAKERMNTEALRRNWRMFVLLGVVGVFGFNILFFEGMKSTSPLNGALIMATNPLVSALLARVILRDRVSLRQGTGIVFSLLGVLLVITQGSWQVIGSLSFSAGDLLLLGGNLCWALYGVLGRGFIRGSSSLATTAYTMTIGAVCLMLFAVGSTGPLPLSSIPWSAWGALAFMAVFASVLGYLWWNRGIAELGISRTAIFFNLVPLVTMLISLLSGTPVTAVQVLGTLLVILGVAVASLPSRKKRPRGAVTLSGGRSS
ncbi:drug/metabolite transporter (DMT)-like permease [Paenibacillus mucilaginosus]|uniref:DMT family transporter n=1 Tax=Paenibacillus mucilaginosus TaxID=61624 RepID=UPI003D1EA81D